MGAFRMRRLGDNDKSIMKRIARIIFAPVLAVLFGCAVEEQPANDGRNELDGKVITIEAFREGDPSTRTMRDEESGSVMWTPGDAISMFYGSGSDGGSKFTSSATVACGKTSFTGTLTAVTAGTDEALQDSYFWGVYPYMDDNSCDGQSVTMTIPSEQEACPGTFASNLFPSIGRSRGLSMGFYNVGGGWRFSVTKEGIKRVTLKSNGGEPITGKVKVLFDDAGIPEVEDIIEGSDEVVLKAPVGKSFEVGKYYYIILLPTTMNSGFTMTFETLTEEGVYNRTDKTAISRSKFSGITNIDNYLTTPYSAKPGVFDAVTSLVLARMENGEASFSFNITTSKTDDYKEYGLYYSEYPDLSKASRRVLGTDVFNGTRAVVLDGLDDDTEYYVWPMLSTLSGIDVVGDDPMKVVHTMSIRCVSRPQDVRTAIEEASEYTSIRLLGGMTVTGGIEMKNRVTVSGGWNADFTAQNAPKTIIEGGDNIPGVVVPYGTVGAVIQNLEITKARCMEAPYNYGAGVFVKGDLIIENCYIHDNRAAKRGGGIGTEYDFVDRCSLTIINSEISHNIAEDGHGAGIYTEENTSLVMVNNLVTDNWSQADDGYSGGLIAYGPSVVINNTFARNYCNGERDGNWQNYLFRTNNAFIVNNVFAGDKNSLCWLTQSIEGVEWDEMPLDTFYPSQKTVSLKTGAGVVFKNNIVQGTADGGNESVNSQNSFLNVDYDLSLLFTDIDNKIFTPAPSSPLLNAGITSDPDVAAYLAKYAKDLVGNPRVAGTSVDIGCYERQ